MATNNSKPTPPKSEQVKEILKCAKDPVYFFTNYLDIQHPIRGRLPFKLYPFQQDVVKAFLEHRFGIINKSRQLGLSTLTGAYALWMALFNRDKEILIMATKLQVGKNLIQKVRIAFQSLPKWILERLDLTELEAESVRYIKFTNGSRVEAIPTASDAGRSSAVSLFVIDEAAHIENLRDLWMGIWSTVSTGGSIVMFSSPSGKGNLFHEIWEKANSGENDFFPIELPWTVHPERTDKWYEDQCKALDERGIAQELNCISPNTPVVTMTGNVWASEIKVGDLVLTHKGKFRRVTKVFCRGLEPKENAYRVTNPENHEIEAILTGNHPLLVSVEENLDWVSMDSLLEDEFSLQLWSWGEQSLSFESFLAKSVKLVDGHSQRPTTVYNFEVEEDNSYVAGGIVVHNCSFESSGRTFFASNVIQELYTFSAPPIAYNGPDDKHRKDMWIWKMPVEKRKYVICADVARGDADDYSAFHVIDVDMNEVVVEYLGKIPPDRYAEFLVQVGKQYNQALIVQEKNAVGVATAIKLRDLAYPNLYYPDVTPEDRVYMTPEELATKLPGYTVKPGQGEGSREEILNYFEEVLRNKRLRIYSSRFAKQASEFIWTGKRGQAAKGKSDDLIMALCIGSAVVKPSGTPDPNQGTVMDWHKAFLACARRDAKVLPQQHGPTARLNQSKAIYDIFGWVLKN